MSWLIEDFQTASHIHYCLLKIVCCHGINEDEEKRDEKNEKLYHGEHFPDE